LALAVSVVTSHAYAASNIVAANDREAANQVWGNISTWGQADPPPANHFSFPIPVGMGARPLGMGEAFTALADELATIWWNPAGLVQTEKNEVHWMAGDRLTDAPFTGFFAANYMLQNRMNFALSYMRPYHPTGFYPDVIAGTYEGFSKWTGTPSGILTIPGVPGTKTQFFDIGDTAVQDFLKKAYRAYIQPPFQENIFAFTYASPLSPDNNLSMGINVKYLFNDANYRSDEQLLNEVSGYGVDLGFLYRYPMRKWGREFAVGLNLKDIAGQVRFNTDPGAGREVTLPSVSTLGIAWKTNEYFTRSDLNLAADLVYINDPSFDDNANRRINLGGEMWFFKKRLAPRAGYSLLFNRQPSHLGHQLPLGSARQERPGPGLRLPFPQPERGRGVPLVHAQLPLGRHPQDPGAAGRDRDGGPPHLRAPSRRHGHLRHAGREPQRSGPLDLEHHRPQQHGGEDLPGPRGGPGPDRVGR
jgi:hypothetical protein